MEQMESFFNLNRFLGFSELTITHFGEESRSRTKICFILKFECFQGNMSLDSDVKLEDT